MTKTTNVGGFISKTIKGNFTSYAGEGIEYNVTGKLNLTCDGEMSFDKADIGPTIPIIQQIPFLPAKCIVQFRPQNNWKGEFGFDWFRIGDTGLKGDVNYETLIGQYYDKALADVNTQRNTDANTWTTFFKADPQPAGFTSYDKIEALKRVYGVFEYSIEKDNAGKPINKKYYKPFIALLPIEPDPNKAGNFIETGKAKLKLKLEFEKKDGKEAKPDMVIFEMDNILMDASHPLASIDKHTISKKEQKKEIDIEITCKAEFTSDKEIKVWAITQDAAGKQITKLQAGVLKMIAPAKKTIKNIVVVIVKTSAGVGVPKKLDIFKRNLKQALIKTNITTSALKAGINGEVKIDLSVPANNPFNLDFNSVCGIASGSKNITSNSRLDDLLTRTLERDYPGQFNNHFKLFFLANTCSEVLDSGGNQISATAGYSRHDSDYGVMFTGHSDFTIAHECLHGLGLPHTFFGDSFLYKAQATDNIMDYSHQKADNVNGIDHKEIDRIATWYWQWKIINNL
ncbi:hypothetical protein SL053_002331 [Flavobacterium psychrophilum]|nr:hypothetical protein [Flavobacterium psychrophilum]